MPLAWVAPPRARAAESDPWPVRPLRLVVGFPSGSSADEIARTLADPLAAALGQPVLVDNRPGYGGLLAARLIAHSDDDHTAALLLNLQLTVAPWLHAEVGYDPARDLVPVGVAASTPLALCASPDVSWRSPAWWRSLAKLADGLRYGSPGVGTPFHLAMEWLKAQTGWPLEHVAYPGNPQVINALLNGEVQLALLPPALVAPLWRVAKLPVLAGTAPGIGALLPGVLDLQRLGVINAAYDHWYALVAGRAWSAAALLRLGRALRQTLRQPAVQAALQRQGWLPGLGDSAALQRRMALLTQQLRPLLERHPSWRLP